MFAQPIKKLYLFSSFETINNCSWFLLCFSSTNSSHTCMTSFDLPKKTMIKISQNVWCLSRKSEVNKKNHMATKNTHTNIMKHLLSEQQIWVEQTRWMSAQDGCFSLQAEVCSHAPSPDQPVASFQSASCQRPCLLGLNLPLWSWYFLSPSLLRGERWIPRSIPPGGTVGQIWSFELHHQAGSLSCLPKKQLNPKPGKPLELADGRLEQLPQGCCTSWDCLQSRGREW